MDRAAVAAPLCVAHRGRVRVPDRPPAVAALALDRRRLLRSTGLCSLRLGPWIPAPFSDDDASVPNPVAGNRLGELGFRALASTVVRHARQLVGGGRGDLASATSVHGHRAAADEVARVGDGDDPGRTVHVRGHVVRLRRLDPRLHPVHVRPRHGGRRGGLGRDRCSRVTASTTST